MHKLTPAQLALIERCAMTGEQIEAAGPRRFATRTVATLTELGLIEQSKRIGLVLTEAGWQWLLDNRVAEVRDNGGLPLNVVPAPTVAPLDCFDRPALTVIDNNVTYVVTSVDEFGAIHCVGLGTFNPGAVPALDAAVYASGLWAFARKPRTADVVTVTPVTETTAESLAALEAVDQLATAKEAAATDLLGKMLGAFGRTPAENAYAVRMALRILAHANGPDSVTARALAMLDEQHPARCVTVGQQHSFGRVQHLVDANGNPVEAGTYTARDGGRFEIDANPDCSADLDSGELLRVHVTRIRADENAPRFRSDWTPLTELVAGWHWQIERV